jgi:hypothetical protein
MVRIGKTVLALREPIAEALARIEQAPDEPIPESEPVATPPGAEPLGKPDVASAIAAPVAAIPAAAPAPARRKGWSGVDLAVMAAALGVLVLSIVGLVWLLRG